MTDLRSLIGDAVFSHPTHEVLAVLAEVLARKAECDQWTTEMAEYDRVANELGLRQRPGTKLAIIEWALLQPKGVTARWLMDKLEWPSISVPDQARQLGLTLTKKREGGCYRYFGRRPS